MHKKLATDLMSIAHRILKMKNKEDVLALKKEAHEVYEKLALLAYVDEYIRTTPTNKTSKEALLSNIDLVATTTPETAIEIKKTIEPITEQPFEALEKTIFEPVASEEKKETTETPPTVKKQLSLEEELHDTISIDVAADLFEKVVPNKSLNDQLQTDISIGLNDRIAFVTNLFDGSQEDFNRVLSQLNGFKTAKEAVNFIKNMVKPDYNWSEKEEMEERFFELILRKFD